MKRPICKICVYRAAAGAPYKCDYAAITGHTRGAVPAEKCRHFRPGERVETLANTSPAPALARKAQAEGKGRPGKGGRRGKYDWARGRQLWEMGLNDREISEELGCARQVVLLWRRRNGLDANAEPGHKQKE